MEGRLDMVTRKRLANRFKAEYAKGTKRQKGEVLDRLVAVGMGRSTARRLLSQAVKVREEPGGGARRETDVRRGRATRVGAVVAVDGHAVRPIYEGHVRPVGPGAQGERRARRHLYVIK